MYITSCLSPDFDKLIIKCNILIIPFTASLAGLYSASIDDSDKKFYFCDVHEIILNPYLNKYPEIECRV